MRFGKKIVLFFLGGSAYVGLELAWRGWSHVSMFCAGGVCFLLLGRLGKACRRMPLLFRGLLGSGVITAVELLAGLLVNRNYRVWDYRSVPGNFLGQICFPFFLLWVPVSVFAMGIYRALDRRL